MEKKELNEKELEQVSGGVLPATARLNLMGVAEARFADTVAMGQVVSGVQIKSAGFAAAEAFQIASDKENK